MKTPDLTISEGHSVEGQVLSDLNLGSGRYPENGTNQTGTEPVQEI